MKKTILTLSLLLLILLPFSIYKSYETKLIKPNVLAMLQKKATPNFFQNKIELLLKNNTTQEALAYYELAKFLKVPIPSKLEKSLEKETTFLATSLRNTQKFTQGFITGEADEKMSFYGSVTSDMMVVGDIRDLYTEGSKLLHNQPYDKFILTLSSIGVALSTSTYVTAGSTLALKVGVSVLKIAKKTKKLTKDFLKILHTKLNKVIDMKLFQAIDFSSLNNLKKSTTALKNSIHIAPIEHTLAQLNTIAKNSSKIDAIKMLSYIHTQQDLTKLVKLSTKFKKHTRVVLKIVGKSAFKGAKVVANYTNFFIAQVILWGFAFVSFIVLLLSNIFQIKTNQT